MRNPHTTEKYFNTDRNEAAMKFSATAPLPGSVTTTDTITGSCPDCVCDVVILLTQNSEQPALDPAACAPSVTDLQ